MPAALQAPPRCCLADRADQIIALALYVWMCARLLPGTFAPLLVVKTETAFLPPVSICVPLL